MQAIPIGQIRIAEPGRETRELTIFAVGCCVIAALTGLAIQRWPLPIYPGTDFTASAWYVVGFKLGYMLTVPLVWLRWRGYQLADLSGPRRSVSWIALGLALTAGLALNLQHVTPIGELLRSSPLSWRVALGFVLPLVAAAIPEELAFRVLLQTRLEKTHGRLVAIALSTLLFTAWHLPSRFLLANGVEGTAGDLKSVLLGTGVPVFVVGLVLAAIWDRWRSALTIVALHYALDLLPSLRHALGGSF